ncbi:PIG-L deacetylase family protein [Thomasclavelia cocleata]|jgi:LmbE family N-acetylglucosaminyl deacetylase|uniref:PIG-L deacetylase family protein n=1 Tax=Thomasclavelia cocleata TaxID=69824 RepID=UPI0025A2B110|nr:PIG-L deacetylase family protein [Thomasclavelia cocleata]
MNKILIVAAHPDDEVLGCFGTVSKMIKNGDEAYTLILSKGKTSRDEGSKEQELLYQEMQNSNASIGIKKVFQLDFPDNAFDSIPLLSIVKAIEAIKNEIKPTIIFTHYNHDINIDHQITAQAVLTAARPIRGETVKEIYFMEVPSSTEWNGFSSETAFVPNVFSDITNTIDDKIKAMKIYQSELRENTHPRSLKHLKLYAKTNGTKVGLEYSENFILVRKEI